MNRKAKVAVVMGGSSAEREISIQTGSGVMRALQSLGYDAQSLDYDRRFVDAIREIAPDVVFNALHGPGGEDGHVQAILDYLGIPYTGSGVEASALAMDKHLTKKLVAAEGLPTAAWDLFDLSGGTLPLLPGSLDLPLVIKPRYEGSSQGVIIVKTHEQWTSSMINAAKSYAQIMAEEFIEGREFTCGVLGEEALPVIEDRAEPGRVLYVRRKVRARRQHAHRAGKDRRRSRRAPANAGAFHASFARAARLLAHRFHREQRRPSVILEVNTLPGLTPTSLIPDACASVGISYEALIDRLIGYALSRAEVANVA